MKGAGLGSNLGTPCRHSLQPSVRSLICRDVIVHLNLILICKCNMAKNLNCIRCTTYMCKYQKNNQHSKDGNTTK